MYFFEPLILFRNWWVSAYQTSVPDVRSFFTSCLRFGCTSGLRVFGRGPVLPIQDAPVGYPVRP